MKNLKDTRTKDAQVNQWFAFLIIVTVNGTVMIALQAWGKDEIDETYDYTELWEGSIIIFHSKFFIFLIRRALCDCCRL